jgi:hypothetical protein
MVFWKYAMPSIRGISSCLKLPWARFERLKLNAGLTHKANRITKRAYRFFITAP